ncbi:deoxynucleoside kinase isoform X2 [Hyalella azteca]|nr:deoxynucleoside kinase isoform X2 [Hyalella azteca]XP_047737681.1 deoxynucleoside kinase isoform X2 [Hyalella azteca]
MTSETKHEKENLSQPAVAPDALKSSNHKGQSMIMSTYNTAGNNHELSTSSMLGQTLDEDLHVNEKRNHENFEKIHASPKVFEPRYGKRLEFHPTKIQALDQEAKENSFSRPFTVSIEGNIGSGKSTFLKHFAALPNVATYQEPLGKWTDVGGYNLLGKLYEDPKRWSFLFQSYVQLTRLHIHLQNDANSSVKLIERSLHNNRYCFVESGHDSGDLHSSEYDVLCEYFDFLKENLDLGIDLIVYLQSTPEVVHQRMQKRGRSEEAGVPLAYLQKLHHYYERWLIHGVPCQPPAPVLVINADPDLVTVTRNFNLHQSIILGQEPLRCASRSDEKENLDPSLGKSKKNISDTNSPQNDKKKLEQSLTERS